MNTDHGDNVRAQEMQSREVHEFCGSVFCTSVFVIMGQLTVGKIPICVFLVFYLGFSIIKSRLPTAA